MAYSNHGGFDIRSELAIAASFANGLDVITGAFIERAKAGTIDPDDACASALSAQAALVSDRLRDILATFERLPDDTLMRIDRLACGVPEVATPKSNVMPLDLRRPGRPKPKNP